MAFVFEAGYAPETGVFVKNFYATLNEKDRRRFLAVEATRMGYGGIEYVASFFGCNRRTVERGIEELPTIQDDPAQGRVRRPGAGRKKKSIAIRS